MKTKKCYLTSAAVIAIFSVLVLADTELLPPLRERVIGDPPFESGLIGQLHPALVEIEQLYVAIRHPHIEPIKDGLDFRKLQEKVKTKLKIAGLKIASDDVPEKFETLLRKKLEKYGTKQRNLKFRSINTPELRVNINMLKLEESQQYVFRVQTSLLRAVYLKKERKLLFKADVWQVKPVMQAVSVKDMPAKVANEVMEQIEAFIYAYVAANPQGTQTSDANNMGTAIQKEPVKPPPTITVAKYNYVASKNSKVFHRPQCSFAGRIAPKNLVGYNSREEAIRAGKRPCKRCRP